MKRKLTSFIIITVLLLSAALTGCGASSVIDSKVKSAVSTSSRTDEAIEWLIANKEIVIPELLNRMSNATGGKAEQAAQALIAMGDTGRTGAIRLFDTMTENGKRTWCNALAQENTKDAVIELLILSEKEASFDIAVSSLVSMGEISLNYLAGQLSSDYFKNTIDTTLANFGESAVPLIIPSVHSSDKQKVNRALVILATVGQSAAVSLAQDALENSENTESARQIASTMLKNYPGTAINTIMESLDENSDINIAAALLNEISGTENIYSVLSASTLGNASATTQVLKKYVSLTGIDPVISLALSADDAYLQGASKALEGGEYDKQVLIAVLNNIKDTDAQGSQIDTIAEMLIHDTNLELLARSVISNDAQTLATVLSTGIDMSQASSVLSNASDNIYTRMLTANNTLEGDMKKAFMTVLASCSDSKLPSIVLSEYANNPEISALAAEALTSALTASGKFMFADVDMSPYSAKITQDLLSSDSAKKTVAQVILSRVSTAKSNNGFYKTIFESYKDKTIFTILAGHYGGAGSLPLNLTIDVNGQQVSPQTVTVTKTGDVKNVSSSKEPDYSALISGFAPYLGWSEEESGADITLEFTCDITPKSKRYSGLIASSYLGAEAKGTLTLYVNGEKIKSVSGYALISPPSDYPGPEGEFRYKGEPEDAPVSDAYVICFINAMYNMWGEKALFGFYNYDVNSTNEASTDIFIN